MKPEIVNLKLTSLCDCDCLYCYASRGSDLELYELIKLFDMFVSWKTKGVVLCGGEPTLRKDFTSVLKELAKREFDLN